MLPKKKLRNTTWGVFKAYAVFCVYQIALCLTFVNQAGKAQSLYKHHHKTQAGEWVSRLWSKKIQEIYSGKVISMHCKDILARFSHSSKSPTCPVGGLNILWKWYHNRPIRKRLCLHHLPNDTSMESLIFRKICIKGTKCNAMGSCLVDHLEQWSNYKFCGCNNKFQWIKGADAGKSFCHIFTFRVSGRCNIFGSVRMSLCVSVCYL